MDYFIVIITTIPMFLIMKEILLVLRRKYLLFLTNSVEDVDMYNADIWLLSPPCQPHTRLGLKNDCLDKRSDGLMHLIDILQKMKNNPKFLLLENVEGFEESRSRELLVQTLKERGYSYLEFILSPNQFRIPNQRDRYYLIARQTSFSEIPESTPRINNCLRVIPGDNSY